MYPISSISHITRWETHLYGGDSESRYDSRGDFFAVHQPRQPVRCTGEVVGRIKTDENGNLEYVCIDEEGNEVPDE